MKTILPGVKLSVLSVLTVLSIQLNAQTPTLEFTSGAGNPTGNGASIANQVITFRNNINNPSGNTFAAFTPTLTATFSLSNQQYTLPAAQISTGRGLSFGANLNASGTSATTSALFQQMNSISAPSNNNFTSSTAVSAGTGINISNNRAVELFTSARALYNAGVSTSGRFYFADLTITFNQPVTNPIIHIVGFGGYYSSLGFTTELELQNSGIILSKLSGSGELNVSSGTKILNSASEPNSNTGAGGASGSVLATGSGINSLTFRVYMRGDGDQPTWGSSSMHAGDVWLIGVSFNAPVNLSGNVRNDDNGLIDNNINGAGVDKPSGTQLYANLLDNSNKVLTSVAVSSGGSFTFTNVATNTNYSVQISSIQGTNSQPAPSVSLPSNWISVGEYLGNGSGNDGNADGFLSIPVVSSNVTDANFGIEQAPNSDTKWYAIGSPVLNSFISLNNLIGLFPGPLSGLDAEDGALGASKKVGITSLPTGNNQLWYNGVQITTGADGINAPSVSNPYVISNYNTSLLSIRFTGPASIQTIFNYAFYDAADRMDATPASYTVTWAIALPVKLVSFTATLNNNKADLKWTTATESNLSHFVIEKSLDGTNFSDAGVVFASGNTIEKMNYTFADNNINISQKAVIYYRLRSIDVDGKYSVSETRVIRTGKEDVQSVSVLTYPNPVSNELRVTVPDTWQGKKVNYEVFANNGQIVFKNEAANASQTETINFSRYAPGFYVIKVSCNGKVAQQKIIKQ